AGEGRHRTLLSGGDGSPLGDDVQQFCFGDDGEEDRVIEGRRRTELAVGPVTAGAVRRVQGVEIYDLVRRNRAVLGPGLAWKVAAAGQRGQEGQESAQLVHDPPPPSPVTKSASRSGPRPAGGMWTVSERSTTTAATTPNTNWETMNQGQSTRSW